MINRLSVLFKNGEKLILVVPNWNEDTPSRQQWNTLFDWYQFSASDTFQLEHNQNTFVLKKDTIHILFSELVEEEIMENAWWQSWLNKIKRKHTS